MRMKKQTPIDKAVTFFKTDVQFANAVGVTPQAIGKWKKKGKMPRTDFTGETRYSWIIEEKSEGEITVESLLGFRPPFHDAENAA